MFQVFHYLNGKLLLTNDLMITPDSEVHEGIEKVNLKLLYEIFKDTDLHRLVSIQFMCVLGKYFGVDTSMLKSTISELYVNLSYETFTGAENVDFQAVSNLTSNMTFGIKKASLENINIKK